MRKKDGVSKSIVFFEVVIGLLWVIQVLMLLSYRFSHTGKVCSGDYAELELINDQNYLTDDKYNEYYIRDEGDFLYYYMVACLILGIVILFLACFVGSMIFMGGSFAALNSIDQILKNIDKLPDMMRQGSGQGGPQEGDGYQR